MTKTKIDQITLTQRSGQCFEFAFLICCLAIVTVRVFRTEPITQLSSSELTNFNEITYSLSLSVALFCLFALWMLCRLAKKYFLYRISYLELPIIIFTIAAAASAFLASDKRIAISNSITTIAPMVTALLLVQLLDSKKKIKLLLGTIVTLGIIAALYCFVQAFWINNMLIEQYQNDPNEMMRKLAITPGSFQQMLFEHSLLSRDVKAFFTTGNSAGSFFLMAMFASLIPLLENIREKISEKKILLSAIPPAILLAAIFSVKSKGAALATLIAVTIFFVILKFGKKLAARKKTVLTICLLLILFLIAVITNYGLAHKRLPGGNSMLVRWQYWQASVKMASEHLLAGVGAGNFGSYYPHYKDPAALETVGDPHNFALSILCQFGIFGLAAFLAAIVLPLIKTFFSPEKIKKIYVTESAVTAAIIGFIVHNLIDFSIFEPGIAAVFWALIAALIASNKLKATPENYQIQSRDSNGAVKNTPILRTISITAISISIVTLFTFAMIPVAKANANIQKAMKADISTAEYLLSQAVNNDPLSPVAPAMNGKMFLSHFDFTAKNNPKLLTEAERCFQTAIKRNNADFKNFKNLSLVYTRFAEIETEKKNIWLEKAFEAVSQAIKRYPGSDELRIKAAEIAEQLGNKQQALLHYKKAVEIEDAYRIQFRTMYPHSEIFSRLGEENYQHAKDRIKILN